MPALRPRLLLLPLLLSLAAACGAEGEDSLAAEDEASRSKVGLNDVSILFPLPAPPQEAQLLGPASAGARGELLPDAFFQKLPRLADTPSGPVTRSMLRVVGVRIDPCFPVAGAGDAAGCKNQLRLVMQPVHKNHDASALTTEDAAVHLFFEVTRDEMKAMALELLEAKRSAGGYRTATSLGVHPLMKKQGTGGAYASAVRAFVLAHAGEKNLTRITFMTREPPRQPFWKFGGFDVENGRLERSRIATLGAATEQTVTTPGFGAFQASLSPAPSKETALGLLFRAGELQAATDEQLRTAVGAALRVENPDMHSPNTIDCASCHMATPARVWVEKARGVDSAALPDRYGDTKLSLVNTAKDRLGASNLRAFGYLGTETALSQRVVNESAAVADYVNAKILGR